MNRPAEFRGQAGRFFRVQSKAPSAPTT